MINKFEIIDSKHIISEVISDFPQTILCTEISGNLSLITKIDHFQINIDNVTGELMSIDGVIPKPLHKRIDISLASKAEKKSLKYLSKFNENEKGIGYPLNFEGKTFYDEKNNCLLIGIPKYDILIKIGLNLYAGLRKEKKHFILTSFLILPIKLDDSFKE